MERQYRGQQQYHSVFQRRHVTNNGTFNDANAFASFFSHNVGGGLFNNTGTYNKLSNTITTVDLGITFNNTGTTNINAGTMRFNSGIQGSTGTVRVASGATSQHDAASVVGNLITAGTLALADRTITVHSDYNNANFGVGDAFNRRANVTTSGAGNRIVAAGDANQGLSGAGVTNGNTTAAALTIGNVRVGSNTFTYNIDNTGTTGPSLRGAIKPVSTAAILLTHASQATGSPRATQVRERRADRCRARSPSQSRRRAISR